VDTPHYIKPDELRNTNKTLTGYKKEAHHSIQHQNAHPLESTAPQDFYQY
jgi:hypothetical protein